MVRRDVNCHALEFGKSLSESSDVFGELTVNLR